MFSRHSLGQSTPSDSASAARVRAAAVGLVWRRARRGERGRLDAVRFNSGGAVMTAGRVDHRSFRPALLAEPTTNGAFTALDVLDLVRAAQPTRTDCPEARMAGGNNNSNSSNNQVR
jgi:hypothetical protein